MPAPYAEECAKLCQHASFTTGCPACRLVDHIKDLAEAKSERLGAIEACQRLQDRLVRATNEQEREDAQESVDQAQSHILAWDKRSLEIESALVDSRTADKLGFELQGSRSVVWTSHDEGLGGQHAGTQGHDLGSAGSTHKQGPWSIQ